MKKTFILILTILAVLLAVYILWLLRVPLMLIFIALLIALAVNKPIHNLRQLTHFSTFACGVLVYIGLAILVIGVALLVLPTFTADLVAMATKFNLWQYIPRLDNVVDSLDGVNDFLSALDSWREILSVLTATTLRWLVYLIAVIIISFYLSVGKNRLLRLINKLVKKTVWTQWLENLMATMEDNLGGWLRVRVILTIYTSGLIFLLLSIFAIPYALALAILAGLLDIVTVIGPIVAALPAIFLAWSNYGASNAIMVAIFYTIVSNAEGIFIAPRLFKTGNKVSPAISILGILCGYILLGLIGALLAIPVIIVGQTFLQCWPSLPKYSASRGLKKLLG